VTNFLKFVEKFQRLHQISKAKAKQSKATAKQIIVSSEFHHF